MSSEVNLNCLAREMAIGYLSLFIVILTNFLFCTTLNNMVKILFVLDLVWFLLGWWFFW